MKHSWTVLGVALLAGAVLAQDPPAGGLEEAVAANDAALKAWRSDDAATAFAEATRARQILLALPDADQDFALRVRHLYALASKRVGLGTGDASAYQWDPLWGAEQEFDFLVTTDAYRSDAETWYQLAHVRAEMAPHNGSYVHVLSKGAIVALDQVLGLSNQHDRAHLLRGRVLGNPIFAEVFNPDAAAEEFTKDLEINPAREESWVRLCDIRMRQSHPEVPNLVEQGLGACPDSSKLQQMRGVIQQAMGRLDVAIASFRAAAEADLKNLDAIQQWIGAVIAEQQQRGQPDPDLAVTLLADFANEFPGAWKAREMRAGILKETGRVDEALAELQGMEQAFPNEPGMDTWLVMEADALQKAGRTEELVAVVRRALERNPKAEEAMIRLATPEGEGLFDHYKRTLRWDKALWLAEELLHGLVEGDRDQDDRRAVVLWVAFEAHENLGQPVEAEKCIQEAIAMNPRDPMYPNAYGLMLRYQGRVDDACLQWRAALEVRVDHPWARENLITTRLGQGKLDEARTDVVAGLEWLRQAEDQAVTSDPDSEESMFARFEHAKMRRLGIETWRLGRLPK